MARTPITPDEVVRAAGFTAGSIPTKGVPGCEERREWRAAAEAVLHAMTIVVAPWSMSQPEICADMAATSSRVLDP